MTPTQMEALAQWHDDEAADLNDCDFGGAMQQAEKHSQSATIIRWAAKVLEVEPVATALIQDPYDEREGFRASLEYWRKLNNLPAQTQLMIKPAAPTFGDDNGQN